jgi:hypothetical protein
LSIALAKRKGEASCETLNIPLRKNEAEDPEVAIWADPLVDSEALKN